MYFLVFIVKESACVRLIDCNKCLIQTLPKQSMDSKSWVRKGTDQGKFSERTVKTSRNQESIKKRFSGNFQVSLWKIERKTGIPRESVGRTAKKELNLHCYTLKQMQFLADENKQLGLEK